MVAKDDIQFKAKRDLLVVSTILIFVNLAQVEIGKFTVFGVSGNVNAPFWAYVILWCIWGYFGYRHVIHNWGSFTYMDRQRWKFISECAEIRALLEVKEIIGKGGPKSLIDDSRDILCKRDKVDGRFEIICEVPILAENYQPHREPVTLNHEFYKKWEKEFDQQNLPKHENFIAKWFPLVIVGLTVLSGLPRLFKWISQFIDWLP